MAEISKYMNGVPREVGDCVDSSLCAYEGFFPHISCILCTCHKCGIEKLKSKIMQLNESKIGDKRKRFMMKVGVTKTKVKDGAQQSYLHWNYERCNYTELLALYLEQLQEMAEHTFQATWIYCQYKKAKGNLIPNDVLIVDDFAQNYLCDNQNEPQGLHWVHEQVTLMPSVAQYKCQQPGCNQTVLHEIAHVSDDLKHDAHFVEAFRARTIEELQKNNVPIHKIIYFTDQAQSQYKNKTAFRYLSQSAIPTVWNFFGARHRKGPCDACT